MAKGTLHAKKENGRNRNGTPHSSSTYARTSTEHGPTLEEATGRSDWPDNVARWWAAWRAMPHAVDFLPTDWQRLALLAPYYAAAAEAPLSAAALAEVRMNEERLGATVVDRMRARIVIEAAPRAGDTSPATRPGSVSPIGRTRRDV